MKALFKDAWPTCWKTFTDCSQNLTEATDYVQVVGIICGQIGVGAESDWIGRRFGLIQDAVIMLLGCSMLIAAWGVNLQGWIIMYTVSQVSFFNTIPPHLFLHFYPSLFTVVVSVVRPISLSTSVHLLKYLYLGE